MNEQEIDIIRTCDVLQDDLKLAITPAEQKSNNFVNTSDHTATGATSFVRIFCMRDFAAHELETNLFQQQRLRQRNGRKVSTLSVTAPRG